MVVANAGESLNNLALANLIKPWNASVRESLLMKILKILGVMRKPEITKNTSTPRKPLLNFVLGR
jgi:hypothetical protein